MWPLLLVGAALVLPYGIKNQVHMKIRLIALAMWVCVVFIVAMPQKAVKSAPFNKYADSEIAFFSCSSHVRPVHFCDAGDSNMDLFAFLELCMCTNINSMATVAHCYYTAYPQLAESFVDRCNKNHNVNLTLDTFSRAHDYYNAGAQAAEDNESLVTHPVKVETERILMYKRAYDQFLGNYNRSINYGMYLVLYWAVVFAVAAVANWAKVWAPGITSKCRGRTVDWVRTHITLPALFGRCKTNEKPLLRVLDLLVPTRLETLLLVVFSGLLAYLSVADIAYIDGDPIFHSLFRAYCRYYAVRTGILASYLFPFCIVFAGRNNILQWLIRWEYATFVMLHRWISRLIMLLIAVHATGYGVLILTLRRARGGIIKAYLWWGLLAAASGFVIIVQSLLVLRRTWYEVFLLVHITLALAFTVGAWLHVKDLYFLWFYYLSAFLWFSDRIFRIQRILAFGFPVAKVHLFEDETLKFFVPRPPGFVPEGGGHCFVHFLKPTCFWQSHPFTYTITENTIVFYVKVKEGVTRDLSRWLEAHPDRAAHVRVAVEGSYGEATPAHKHQSAIFVAGGNGIPGIFAEAVEVIAHTPAHLLKSRRIKLIWVVRQYESVLWFYDELQELKDLPIETDIYVTRPSTVLLKDVNSTLPLLHNTYLHLSGVEGQKQPVEELKRSLPHVRFNEGRPDIEKIVMVSVEESLGPVCFVPCGHPLMVDDLRHYVAEALEGSDVRVDFYEQLQVWA